MSSPYDNLIRPVKVYIQGDGMELHIDAEGAAMLYPEGFAEKMQAIDAQIAHQMGFRPPPQNRFEI